MPRTPTGGGSKPRKLKRMPAPPPRKLVQRGHASEGGRVVRGQPQRGHAAEGPKVLRRATQRPLPKARREQLRKAQKVVSDTRKQRYLKEGMKRAEVEVAANPAPVLKALEQTTRPLHGIAAGTRAAIHGRNVPKAVGRGLANKDKSTFSDVLKDLGAPKVVRNVGGFALDVAADPTTYVTFGAGSVARKAALDAGKAAERKALRKGLSKPQAAKFRARAEKQTLRRHPDSTGATVKVGGREVPKVRKATAKASQPVRKLARRATPEGARTHARSIVADVNPNTPAAGATRAESQAAVQATRTARAKTNVGRDTAQKQALAIKKRIGEDNYARVIDALESGNLKSLSPELKQAAQHVRSHLRYANRLRRQAGIRGGERKNYVPHQLTAETLETEGKKAGGVGSKVIRPSSSRARKEQRSLKQLRVEEPGRYSENLPELFAKRMAEGHQSAAKAELNRRLAAQGRDVKKGMELPDGSGTHAVFQIKGSDIRQVTDHKELTRLIDEGGKSGRYVVLNKDIVKRATEGVTPQLEGPGVIHAYDKAQSGFKRLAIATPGFHVRNIVGDTQNAYLGQAGRKLPGNLVRSSRLLKAAGRQDKANLSLSRVTSGKGRIKTGRYGTVTFEQAARQLARHGAYRTGYTAKELPELAASGSSKTRLRSIVPQWLKRAGLNREDLPRLATAVEALRNGASWEEAASGVANLHFDYQHLTRFERQVGRRLVPFYTWSARNIPLQARSFFQKPGKYAQYQKLREEAAKIVGTDEQDARARDLYDKLRDAGVKLPDGWERYLSGWEQRNAGVPVSWKGHKFTVSVGLPLTDLNEMPGFADGQGQEYFQKAMSLVTPLLKNPTEYFSNYSFFFRDQIEREYSPNVAAPAYVGAFPNGLKKDLGVVKIRDKRSGKMVWGWPAKVDYIAKQVPGAPNFVQQYITGGADRRGRDQFTKALGFLGFRTIPIDPSTVAVGLAYERLSEIAKKKGSLNQQGIGAKFGNITPAYRKLLDQEKLLKQIAYSGKQARGDAVLPTQGGPPKPRHLRRSTSSTDSSGFDLSGLESGSGGRSPARDSSGFDLSGLD